MAEAEETLKYLYEQKEKYQEQVQSDNSWIETFKKNKNIMKLDKNIIDELVDCIYVHEGGDITIEYKFDEQYENAINYIQENEELAQNTLRAI